MSVQLQEARYKARSAAQVVLAALAAISALGLAPRPAAAHPHVFVGVETTVDYKDGKVAGLEHKWTFDDLYSADAVQGLDKNNDGTYSREELAELAKVNMDGLKEVNYFTFVRLGDKALKTAAPVDPWLEYKDSILSLHFGLPLEDPVAADASGLTFAVYDETFYIALTYADASAVKLSEGAPAGCAATLIEPKPEEDAQKLSEAFSTALGGGSYGATMSKIVSVSCAKS
jgi:ABC-type uncharacterized transport system substrate-binding protein